MSKIIYVVSRLSVSDTAITEKIKIISDSLNPDNIEPVPSKVFTDGSICYGISNPTSTLYSKNSSVLFGQSFGDLKDWYRIGGQKPDGNYVIFREGNGAIEILSDVLGTKSVWYYKDETVFIASTSQRAIIQYLGNFQLNHNVIPWMACNGLLGPGESWDRRFSIIPPDSSLLLDKESWKLSLTTHPVVFSSNGKKDQENIRLMEQCIRSVFSEISLDYSKWKLTLSGGYDSRGILFSLPKQDASGNVLKTLTWGLKVSAERVNNDAFIAKNLAGSFNLDHTYYFTDNSSDEPLEIVLDRFIKNGEGRIDHLGGYMDGFKIWKKLFEDEVEGVIRGDEVFGSYNFLSDFHLKQFIGLTLPEDYSNLDSQLFHNVGKFRFPKEFERAEDETFQTWRDRLYHSYLVPVFLAALGDLKQPFVEQINPLLSRKIVALTRQLPDRLRTNKKIFRAYVQSYDLDVPYASEPAIKPLKDVFRERKMVDLIKKELSSEPAGTIFKKELLGKVLTNLHSNSEEKSTRKKFISRIKALIPKSLKRQVLKRTDQKKMDFNMLGFRLFLIIRMVKLFEEDSRVLNDSSGQVNYKK